MRYISGLLHRMDDLDAAQILPQVLRHHHGAVGQLVLLNHGGEDAGRGQTGAVEGVDVLGLAGGLAAEADAAAAEEELLKCYTFSDEAPVRPPFIRGVVT